eukprot:gene9012-10641_t
MVERNAVREIEELITQSGVNINDCTQAGCTALWYACEDNFDDVAVALSYGEKPTKFTADVVKAILSREKRLYEAVAKIDEPKKDEPQDSWILACLAENGVPENVARSCNQALMGEGFFTPEIFASYPLEQFRSHNLTNMGIKGQGLQHLLMNLHAELHAALLDLKKNGEANPLWSKGLVNKKRSRV